MLTKICTKCKKEQEISQFPHSHGDYRSSRCRTCKNTAKREYNKSPSVKEYKRQYNKKWREANKDRAISWQKANGRKVRLKSEHGISVEEYDRLRKSQNYSCAICRLHENDFGASLYVDHNHQSGVIRGLLCRNCNSALGLLQDSPEILAKAIAYLGQKPPLT